MGGGNGGGRVEVIDAKGCSRLFMDFSSSFRGIPTFSLEPLSPAAAAVSEIPVKTVKRKGPFSGLVICVTGLSKETRKQVKEATERLGGQYSPHLHPHCTHLVVQSFHGRKFEHAMQHGTTKGLVLVTIGWFVDSVKRNVRLKEKLYSVNSIGDNGLAVNDLKRLDQNSSAENSCLPSGLLKHTKQSDFCRAPGSQFSERERKRHSTSTSFSGQNFYVDVDVPAELLSKGASRVTSSADKISYEERRMKVNLAKDCLRKRRNHQMQTCQTPIRPITPGSLLDSICWSISKPTSTASIYTESSSVDQPPVFFDAKEDRKKSEASFVNLFRPLTESVKSELILKGRFLTIMFPVDRFSEMGPCARTFFSSKGFTCMQVLDYIYAFYQENMSSEEIELAIYTGSRHADRLRSIYSSKETAERGYVEFRRIDFLGSRRSFEMLKRVQGDNNGSLYELLIGA